ncbi:hypothetical protein PENSPDRAFT_404394 [Peniophora sp. CONT]|nr:hypothetical protein PENSPDRAFT_404394 [Peniophora sp. CONT]
MFSTSNMFPVSSARLSTAQTLPIDVLAELFYLLALVEPPTPPAPAPSPVSTLALNPTTSYPDWCSSASTWFDEQEHHNSHTAHEKGSLGWISLTTHVCSHWRATALSLGALWGRVVHTFPRALEPILLRASGAPLELDFARRWWCCRTCSRFECYCELARRNAYRLRWLRGPASALSARRVYPLLRELHLTGPGPHGPVPTQGRLNKHERSNGHTHEHGLGHAVTLHAPALERLIFDGAALIPFCAPSLRVLVLHSVRPGACPSSLLALLRTTPRLEELEITFSLAHGPPTWSCAQHTAVELPWLKAARLAGPAERLSLWGRIRAPATSVQVHAFAGTEGVAGLDTLLEALSARHCGDVLGLVHGDLDFTVTVASADALGQRLQFRMLYRDVVALCGTMPAYAARVLSHFNIERFKALHAGPCLPAEYHCEDDWFGPRETAAVLSPMTGLREISLSWEAKGYQAWLLALGCTGDVVLPRLETLVFVANDECDNAKCSQERWACLIAVLEERTRRGFALPRLVLRGECDVKNSEARALCEWARRFVGVLVDERVETTDTLMQT